MTSTEAFIMLAAAGAVFVIGGLYANYRLHKWMANYDKDHKQ